MIIMRIIYIIIFFKASLALSLSHYAQVLDIAQKIRDPKNALKEMGTLLNLGNASRERAQIIFLPEIHDDARSLLTQLLLIAEEKRLDPGAIILDESLNALEKSSWDLYSQKALEVIAAKHSREEGSYSPRDFEALLKKIATKLRRDFHAINYQKDKSLWVAKPFVQDATAFYGWDLAQSSSMLKRNLTMIDTLKKLVKDHTKIIVMLGARHVPDLEYLTNKKILCKHPALASPEAFFNKISDLSNKSGDIPFEIGAALPLFNYLQKQSYAVLFSQDLYGSLDRLVSDFHEKLGKNCLDLFKAN
jgi:hypothetical protein